MARGRNVERKDKVPDYPPYPGLWELTPVVIRDAINKEDANCPADLVVLWSEGTDTPANVVG